MMDGKFLFLFINITAYLIFHNLKFRRYADATLYKQLNALFSGMILLTIFLFFRFQLWGLKLIAYIDIVLMLIIIFIVFILFRKSYARMKHLFQNVFEKKVSIIESLFLTALLVAGFMYDSILVVGSVIFLIFIVKEAFHIGTNTSEPDGPN